MKRNIFAGLFAAGVAVIAPMTATAEDFTFTYNYEGAELSGFGTQRNVPTDAAMLLKNPSLVGSKIVGISVDIPYIKDCTVDPTGYGFLTTELKLKGDDNDPDIIETAGQVTNVGTEEEPQMRLDVTFAEPYTLTEEGVYVGYTLFVTNCKTVSGWTAKYPLLLVNNIDQPQAFMIHARQATSTLPSKYPIWYDLGADKHQALAMRVILSGEQHDAAVSAEFQQEMYAAPSTTGNVFTMLTNGGAEPVELIEYTYTVDDRVVTNEYAVNPPLAGQVGATALIDLPFEVPAEEGAYNYDVRITKVNGLENGNTASVPLTVNVVPFLPVNRPIIDDYTAFWCQFCPSAYVAVRQIQDKYGEFEALAVSYHVTDDMSTVEVSNLPNADEFGTPSVFINRTKADIDNLEYDWLRARRQLAPADLDVKLYWADNSRKSVIAQSNLKFIYDDPEADYKMVYVMVEDDMSDPSWAQVNAYWNKNYEGKYWDLFCGQKPVVLGLVYNDMALYLPETNGIAGSVPANIVAGEDYGYNYEMSLSDAICRYSQSAKYGENVIKNVDKVRVVALLLDNKTGKVCNAATTGYTADAPVYGTVGVDELGEGVTVLTTEYYSLDGLRLSEKPEAGVCIVVEGLSDGTVRTAKAAF